MPTMNDGYNAPDIKSIRKEATEVEVDDRIMRMIEELPEPVKSFVLALLAKEETGEMPLPPMPPTPSFVPPAL